MDTFDELKKQLIERQRQADLAANEGMPVIPVPRAEVIKPLLGSDISPENNKKYFDELRRKMSGK